MVRSRDQIPLDLGEEPEQGDHHLGLHVLLSLEADRFLDGDEADLALHQLIDEPDHLPQAPAEAGQLADDQAVPRASVPSNSSILVGSRPFREEACASTKRSMAKRCLLRIIEDSELLVGQVLGTGGNAEVGDRFHAPVYEKPKVDFFLTDIDHNSRSICVVNYRLK